MTSAEETSAAGAQTWKQSYTYADQSGSNSQYGNRRIDTGNTTANVMPVENPQLNALNNQIAAGQGYGYDSVGNLKDTATGHHYAYDGESRMVAYDGGATTSGGASYSYNGDGQRVKKMAGVVTTIFVYNVMGQVVAEYSSEQAAGNGTSYVTSDSLGSPRVITGEDQGVKARHDYLPFGEEVGAQVGGRSAVVDGHTTPSYGAIDGVKQKFTGYERDIETGLDYAHARYYANSLGRFTSVDPLMASSKLEQPQTWNRYTYAINNPLAYVDPDGEDNERIIKREYEFTVTKYVGNGNEGEIEAQATISVNETVVERTDDNGKLISRTSVAQASAVDTGNGRVTLSTSQLDTMGAVTADIVSVATEKGFDRSTALGIAAEETLLGAGGLDPANKNAPQKAPDINPMQLSGGNAVATGNDISDRRANIGKAIDLYNANSNKRSVNGNMTGALSGYAGPQYASRVPVMVRNINDIKSRINSTLKLTTVSNAPYAPKMRH